MPWRTVRHVPTPADSGPRGRRDCDHERVSSASSILARWSRIRRSPGTSGPHPEHRGAARSAPAHRSASIWRRVRCAGRRRGCAMRAMMCRSRSICRRLGSEAAFRWPADPVARGGMAQIFAGEDKRLGTYRDPEGAARRREPAGRDGRDVPAARDRRGARAREAAASGIVKIYQLGKSTAGWPFCVLERVDGVRCAIGSTSSPISKRTASRERASGSSCCRASWDRGGARVRARAPVIHRDVRRTTSCSANAARRR